MADQRLNFLCLVDGESTSFPVGIESTKTIGDLKDEIKTKKTPRFDDVAAHELTLWRVSIPLLPKKDRKDISLRDVAKKDELDETDDLSDVFPDKPPKMTIHIIVQRPPQGEGWRQRVAQIENNFFAPDSGNYTGLVQFVKG
ncbi:hypothetical protein BGZ96_004062, partial [Linnemannia gamsii]